MAKDQENDTMHTLMPKVQRFKDRGVHFLKGCALVISARLLMGKLLLIDLRFNAVNFHFIY